MKPLSKNKWDKNEYDLWKLTEKCLKWSICTWIFVVVAFSTTAWKVSKLGVFLVHIFLHLDWVLRDSYLSVFCRNDQVSVRIRKTPNMDTFRAVCVLTFASVHFSVKLPVYTATTLKVMQRKTRNTAWDVRLY